MAVTFVKNMNVHFSFEDIAMEFIRDNPNRQREFLEWIATYYRHDMTKERWQSQCHSIANNQNWIPKNKDDCIDMLEILIHELKNSKGATK